jgi:hypothetical protein
MITLFFSTGFVNLIYCMKELPAFFALANVCAGLGVRINKKPFVPVFLQLCRAPSLLKNPHRPQVVKSQRSLGMSAAIAEKETPPRLARDAGMFGAFQRTLQIDPRADFR